MNVTLQNYNTYPALSRQIPDISGQEDDSLILVRREIIFFGGAHRIRPGRAVKLRVNREGLSAKR
jgi:hypothetical protein